MVLERTINESESEQDRTEAAQLSRLTIVVPCFNERESIPQLESTLQQLINVLTNYDCDFILVDDGSCDGTGDMLHKVFSSNKQYQVIRHDENRGVMAAIMTGIRAAESEIVASLDSDCSYDPTQLEQLVPRLTEDVAMVTASPYHPDGNVRNVPQWRLMISKAASLLYTLVMNQKLCTYTSCFRVYRKKHIAHLSLEQGGFVGVAELVWQLQQHGSRIVEVPAVLDVRRYGQSKLRVLRVAMGHLRLLTRILVDRLLGRP